MEKILVFGANGQIGSAAVAILGLKAIPISRAECDLSDVKSISAVLAKHKPSAIINAAAYTAVDKAEEETELAHKINSVAPGVMAEYAKANNIPLVHYSTDYVFDGTGDMPWLESSHTNPINAYGKTKLDGEKAVEIAGGKHLIFRTSWVYDATGKNFPNTMLRLGADRKNLKVVADQIGAPSYAPMLAEATIAALEKATLMAQFPSGIYNLCNSGFTNWHEFASEIFAEARKNNLPVKVKNVLPIKAVEYPTPAKRPYNSRLSMQKLKNVFGIEMPTWKDGLKACMTLKSITLKASA